MELSPLLTLAIDKNASDLHLSTGLPPRLRIDGDLVQLDMPALQAEDLNYFLQSIMSDEQLKLFHEQLEIDFSFQLDENNRYRVNVFQQMKGISAVFRIISSKIRTVEELGFPPIFKDIASLSKGIVLVTGPTGSGKSTTLAGIIDYINANFHKHIVTIEDPIEFIYSSKKCLINQREVHRDTLSFNAALRSVLREDPDIVLIGELRDYETIRLAMTAAETGHLVLSTLHTSSAAKTINRIIDVFPGEDKAMIRTMLSESLQAVIAQSLVKKIGGGRIPALEVMICTPAIRNLIREDKIAQIYSAIQTGQKMGMHTLEQHLRKLIADNLISEDTAAQIC